MALPGKSLLTDKAPPSGGANASPLVGAPAQKPVRAQIPVARRAEGWIGWLLAGVLLLTPVLAGAAIALQMRGAGEAERAAMQAAGSLYARGEFALAAQAWQQLAEQGVGGTALNYNLGVAQLQAGELDGAVQTLRAARDRWPRNAEIRIALEEALRAQRVQVEGPDGAPLAADQPAPEQPAGAIARIKQRYVSRMELALGALLAWTLFAAMLVITLLAKRSRARSGGGIGAALSGIALLFLLVTLLA